jgi:hypothetical protein
VRKKVSGKKMKAFNERYQKLKDGEEKNFAYYNLIGFQADSPGS